MFKDISIYPPSINIFISRNEENEIFQVVEIVVDFGFIVLSAHMFRDGNCGNMFGIVSQNHQSLSYPFIPFPIFPAEIFNTKEKIY